jgi:hypothetical protein
MRRIRVIPGRYIIIQVIHVTWDKSSRGGRLAELRNQIPLALPLPDQLEPHVGRHLLIHESHWGHTNEFATEVTSTIRAMDSNEGFRYRCVSVRATQAGAELEWTWNDWGGIPSRRFWNDDGNVVPATHKAIIVENEWSRARWNGRFTCIDTGTWRYESVTTNVGVCAEAEIPADFFTRSKPADEYSQMAYLR